jgi:hypothetical protein
MNGKYELLCECKAHTVGLEYGNDRYKNYEREGIKSVVPVKLAVIAQLNKEAAYSKKTSHCGHNT